MRTGIEGVCKDCKDRYPACHDYCERYLDAREEHEKRKAVIREEKQRSEELYRYKVKKFKDDDRRKFKYGK